jgi:hypothetical protein
MSKELSSLKQGPFQKPLKGPKIYWRCTGCLMEIVPMPLAGENKRKAPVTNTGCTQGCLLYLVALLHLPFFFRFDVLV